MNEGGVREAFSKLRVEEIRTSLASLLGVSPGALAFIKNTSEGLNIAAQALDLKAGDNVIQAEMDHPNQVYAWKRLEDKRRRTQVGAKRGRLSPPWRRSSKRWTSERASWRSPT